MEASIRAFTADDIEFALAQTSREGWDPTAELFQACLTHDPDGCFIAQADGRRVGLVTTTRYRHSAWVGNLIVPPEHRGQGVGRHLTTHAMAHLASCGAQTVRLEADPPGIGLYRRLGFVDEFESLRFRLVAGPGVGQTAAERITASDLPAVAAFDGEHFGDDRGRLLQLLFQRVRAAYGLRADGRLRGYAFTMPSRFGIRIGPWVAIDGGAAETLLQSILAAAPDTTLVLGVPSANVAAIGLLESCGFKRTPSSFRMIYGERVAAGRPENVFAIANGAMG